MTHRTIARACGAPYVVRTSACVLRALRVCVRVCAPRASYDVCLHVSYITRLGIGEKTRESMSICYIHYIPNSSSVSMSSVEWPVYNNRTIHAHSHKSTHRLVYIYFA